jgi:SAM-dependent methyltransferase
MTDAVAVRDDQQLIWDHVSPGWQRWQPEFEQGARVATAKLLDLAGIVPGQTVLDIGSGIGEPALSAARLVGPAGKVVGVDLSSVMIAAARHASVGLDNVEFIVGDLETAVLPRKSFDVALSRWALMFAADRVDLLRLTADLLKPGGVLAAALWGKPWDVPMISLAFRVISGHLGLSPPPPGPGPFSMSDPDAVRTELDDAGFNAVEIHEVTIPFRFDSVGDFARFSRDVLPPRLKQLLQERCGSVDDAAVWAAFATAARDYQTADGTVSLPSVSLCLRAVARGSV